ncbi:Kae1-associated serine/threonine protein kinase [Candidatus Woesearchaeota archaeon]|nr:Kae1-associated serine/threonine protein kinase [Candidatus Woesearchaeota archaeon]
MEKIAQGAEAKIFIKEDRIIKHRFEKKYRIPEIGEPLRKFRTRREAKVIGKLPPEVKGPKLIEMDDTDMKIEMSYIDGPKVRDILEENIDLAEEIGRKTAVLHNNNIIHGDLTTSNMIYFEKEIYFIDFGLSFFSHKIEDMAVDIHLLRQALESKHHTIYKKAYELFLKGYKEKSKDYDNIIKRLKKVEKRGRYKKKC